MALSAPLLTRKRVIKVMTETTKGTKVAGTNAILVEGLEIHPTAPYEERKASGLYRGPSVAGVLGELSGQCKFKTELRSGGDANVDPALAQLLTAAGFYENGSVFNIHSTPANDQTVSIDVWEDGVKKGLAGASGKITFVGEKGGRMMCDFEFDGIWQAPIDEALPAYSPSTIVPMKMQSGIFTLASNSIKISKFQLNLGNKIVPRLDVNAPGGIAYYLLTDYEPVVSIDPEADKIAGYDYNGIWLAGTPAAIALTLTDGSNHIAFSLPKVVTKELKEADREGIQIYDLTGECLHNSGNDAVVLTAS